MVLTTAVLTTTPASKLKQIFDPDLILGLALGVTLEFVFGYIAINLYHPLTGRPLAGTSFDFFGYDDFIMYAVEIAGILLTKGRLRKIFIYALWFQLFLKLAMILQETSHVGFM